MKFRNGSVSSIDGVSLKRLHDRGIGITISTHSI